MIADIGPIWAILLLLGLTTYGAGFLYGYAYAQQERKNPARKTESGRTLLPTPRDQP